MPVMATDRQYAVGVVAISKLTKSGVGYSLKHA